MVRNVRDKLIWLVLGVFATTILTYEFSADLTRSLVLGAGALMVGILFLAFYAANEA